MPLHDDAARSRSASRAQTRKALGIPDNPDQEPIKVPEGRWTDQPTDTVNLPGDTGDYKVHSGYEEFDPPDDDGIVRNEQGIWQALPTVDYTHSGIEPTPPGASLAQAWAAVMAEVQEIRKNDRFSGGGTTYQYRGVDAVVNTVGPALRKHRVMILPAHVEAKYRDVSVGRNATPMRECTVIVTYEIRGITDEVWIVAGAGESLDVGDKGTTKACTVAYRNLLLTALSVPVDNPRLDADAQEYRRSAPTNLPDPVQIRDEVLTTEVSYQRLAQIYAHINPNDPKARFPQLGYAVVRNENGDDERLASLVWRIRNAHPDHKSGRGEAVT
jgi:hypothetical protein